ncbi:protein phosphatase 1 regulatory subunit 35 [Scomber scombrus]|uniref:Protein phosphatase 1 regulatory subunit 35 n=1 Tax=Scomber scombrus TaxID=13677 RepID=A0AAV1QIX5_SCOSC
MKSSASFLSPPPSPHPAPLPLPSSSSLIGCPELDLSVNVSPAPKTGPPHMKPRPLQTGRIRNSKVVATVTPEPHIPRSSDALPQQPTSSQRKRRGGRHGGSPSQRAELPPTSSNEDSGCLEEAELHSTLALRAELQSLQGAEFNSQKAVQETLRKSERTKNLINSKATEGVNVSRSQLLFSSLVSVDVQQDQLISQVLQDRLLLAPPPRSHDNKAAEGPSPLLFMTSDLLRQKPLPLEEEPMKMKLRPSTCPAPATFDLYSRRRRWEA